MSHWSKGCGSQAEDLKTAAQAVMPSAGLYYDIYGALMHSLPVPRYHFEISCWPEGAGSSRFSGLTPVRICYVIMVYNSCMGHLLRRLKLSTSHPEAFLSINDLVVRSDPPLQDSVEPGAGFASTLAVPSELSTYHPEAFLSINELVVRSDPPLQDSVEPGAGFAST